MTNTATEELVGMLNILKESAISDKLNTKIDGITKQSFDYVIDETINTLKALTEENKDLKVRAYGHVVGQGKNGIIRGDEND